MQTHLHIRDNDLAFTIEFRPETEGKPATLDLDVLEELDKAIDAAAESRAQAIIVTAPQGKYFVVGANVNALQQLNADSIVPWVERGHAVFNKLEACTKPVIAATSGLVLGGGLELALACDWIVADGTARFGMPEATLGLVPGWGGTRRLPRKVGPSAAKLMILTAATLDGEAARRIGLVDVLVKTRRDLDAEVDRMIDAIASLSPTALAQCKQLLSRTDGDPAQREAEASRLVMNDPQTQQRLADFFESRRRRKE